MTRRSSSRAKRTTPATSLNACSERADPLPALTYREMEALSTMYLQMGSGNPTRQDSMQACLFFEETRESVNWFGVSPSRVDKMAGICGGAVTFDYAGSGVVHCGEKSLAVLNAFGGPHVRGSAVEASPFSAHRRHCRRTAPSAGACGSVVWGPASSARVHGRVATSGSSREGGVAELCKYLLQPRFQPAVDRDEVAA